MTQTKLAELSGVNQSLISQLENSTTATGSEYTNRLARALSISADWLADEIGEMTPTLYSTSDPTLVEIMKVLEPRADYLKNAAYKAVITTCELVDQAKASNTVGTTDEHPIRKRAVNAHQRRREMDQQPELPTIRKKRDVQ